LHRELAVLANRNDDIPDRRVMYAFWGLLAFTGLSRICALRLDRAPDSIKHGRYPRTSDIGGRHVLRVLERSDGYSLSDQGPARIAIGDAAYWVSDLDLMALRPFSAYTWP